ncbi:MAG: hypothetical protein COV75_06870 [Candidatus Omnitrophica bacterium CG11_big_fil_rev_8_21_14_0_20_63_9]|nr:MAG: hypothetical protein COV75_06870 [Candidatus Omnitrophica bacterium CG11_big_fil_rev_8_21_14_0_20_63_9]
MDTRTVLLVRERHWSYRLGIVAGLLALVLAMAGIVWAQTAAEDTPGSSPNTVRPQPAASSQAATSPEDISRSRWPEPAPRRTSSYDASAGEFYRGKWVTGGGVGVLGSTPDDAALAMSGHLDYFVNDQVSVGPLLQLGVTDDLTQVGLSGQGKYWIDLPGTNGRSKLNLQSGVGFAHADLARSDTSWLVPLGIGYDYTPVSGPSWTGTFLVNFSNLSPGGGQHADVMPGFLFGARF